MLFDWFTLIAQLVNFIVLVWLLKRFLYKPILHAIDEREKHIAMQLKEAKTSKAEANKQLENYQLKNSEFDKQRQTMLNEALGEINIERQKLQEQTRNEIENLRLQLHETLRTEQQNLNSEITRRTRSEVFAIARKTLLDLANVRLEDQMISVFIHHIKDLNPAEKKLLLSALVSNPKRVFIRSVFELSLNQQTELQNAITSHFPVAINITFETAPHLVSGIELIASGYKLVWSIEDYLGSLQTSISELLNEKSETPTEIN